MRSIFAFLLCQVAAGQDPHYASARVDDILAVSILQVHVDLQQTNSSWPTSAWLVDYTTRHFADSARPFESFDLGVKRPEKRRTALLQTSALISKVIVCIVLAALGITVALLLVRGLQQKQPREIHHTLPRGVFSLVVMTNGFVYFSTEIYTSSLPNMELDLGGTQSLMSGTVQINLLTQLGL